MTPESIQAVEESRLSSLGPIPTHWDVVRLRFCAMINPSRSEVNMLPDDMEVSFVPMDAVHEFGGLRLEQTQVLAEVVTDYTYFRDGDIVVAKITPSFENGKGAIAKGLTNGLAFGTTELHVLRPQDTLDPMFLFYVTISHPFRSIGTAYMYGAAGQKRVPGDFLLDFCQPIPPLNEQKAIAAFLDTETSRIDALIEKKHRQIELLQEKRVALISHAVTKGLDPNAPMRDSGISWLGEMPTTWRKVRLKYLVQFMSGGTPDTSRLEYWGGAIPWASPKDMKRLRLTDTQDYITKTAVEESATAIVPEGTLLIVVRSGILQHTLPVAIVSQPMAINQDIKGLVPRTNGIDSEYLARFVEGHNSQLLCEWRKEGTTVESLEVPLIADFEMVLPCLDEQRAIVNFLDREINRMDILVEKIDLSIELLREYRTALISAAVTGKIDVRKEVA